MGWFNDLKGFASSSFNAVAEFGSDAIHTAHVAMEGFEEGIGTIGGLAAGTVGSIANGTVRITGDVASWAGVEGADEWEIYEGGWSDSVHSVNRTITEGIDSAQAAIGITEPVIRNDFDRAVFGVTKGATEVVAGIAVVAATGGAGAAVLGGSLGAGAASAGSIVVGSVTGLGGAITGAATGYSMYANVNEQFELKEQNIEQMDSLLDSLLEDMQATPAPAGL
jgi:hypothetical protein